MSQCEVMQATIAGADSYTCGCGKEFEVSQLDGGFLPKHSVPQSGYVLCKCRYCMETAIADDMERGAFCGACVKAGCPDYQGVAGMSQECQVEPECEYDGCDHEDCEDF